jgi:hypothetical protein
MPGFISFPNIVSFAHQQVFFFYDSQKGVVMDRRLAQQMVGTKIFVQLLDGHVRIGFAPGPDDVEHIGCGSPGPTGVTAGFGIQAVKSLLFEGGKPALHCRHRHVSQSIVGEHVLFASLASEILILEPSRFGQHRADDFVPDQRDLFAGILVHPDLLCLLRQTIKVMVWLVTH